MYRSWRIVVCLFGVIIGAMIIINVLQIRGIRQRMDVQQTWNKKHLNVNNVRVTNINHHTKVTTAYATATSPTDSSIGIHGKYTTIHPKQSVVKDNDNGKNVSVKRSESIADLSTKAVTPHSECQEIRNLAFLKVHKTGSSTIANIVQRFGLRRNLSFALPNKKPDQLRYNYFGGIGGKLKKEEILQSRRNGSYNLLYNHVIFDKDSFQHVFGNHTIFVTLLREPFAQFTSALLYFVNEKLYKIATSNLTKYLENPDYFEPDNRFLSFTDNRQALDLGVPVHKVRHRRYINNYVKVLDGAFDLVMITEFFDESLILLKRRMCWSFRDILYFRKNTGYRKFKFNVTDTDIFNYRSWAMADNLIYDHFYHKFMDSVSLQPYFDEEVLEFKDVLKKVGSFCDKGLNGSRIAIDSSRWSSAFDVTSLDCLYMRCNELRLHNMLYHHTKHG